MPDHSLMQQQLPESSSALVLSPVLVSSHPSPRHASFLVVPDWWAATIPGGFDYCNVRNAPRFALLVALVTLIIIAYQNMDSKTLEAGVTWLEQDLYQGGIVFVAVMAVAHVLLVPGAVFCLAAGAIFGVLAGSALAWLGTTVGQTLAFCMGRFLLRDWVANYMTKKFPQWAAVDSAISKDGWKLITLLRLSPIIPWNVLNYAVSVTGISLASFTVSSALAIIPWSTTLVYFGSLARSMADVLSGQALPGGATNYLFFIISGVVLVVLVAFATIVSRQRIRAAMKEGTLAGQDIVDELDRMSLIGSPRPPSEPTDSPAASAHQWASPSFVRQTQDAGSEQELSFHRPFREGHKPGHARADRAASLADERLSVDGRGVGPTRGHHKLSDRSNSTSLRHEV